jgi:hypothetical protein
MVRFEDKRWRVTKVPRWRVHVQIPCNPHEAQGAHLQENANDFLTFRNKCTTSQNQEREAKLRFPFSLVTADAEKEDWLKCLGEIVGAKVAIEASRTG